MARCVSFQCRKCSLGCLIVMGFASVLWFTFSSRHADRLFNLSKDDRKVSWFGQRNSSSSVHIYQSSAMETQERSSTGGSSLVMLNNAVDTVGRNAHSTLRVFNASKESQAVRESVANHQCVRFRTQSDKETKICVHPRAVDVYVSGSIINSGIWEGELVSLMATGLIQHPGMVLLDLGCNIGVFSLYAADMGRKVVSVDASKENLLLLTRSLNLNNFQDRVMLVWNALSDVRENVILKGYKENKGGTYVQPTNVTDPDTTVQTTLLDDLALLFKNESIYIKMDIETYEWKALNGGWEFFKTMDVRYVLMEFSSHRKRETGKQICEFFTKFGFRPFTPNTSKKELNLSDYPNWPVNVLWWKN